MRVLVINPGATSTKVAVFLDGEPEHQSTIEHPYDIIKAFGHVNDQIDYRLNAVHAWLESLGLKPTDLAGVAGRGGLIRHVASGTYEIDQQAVEDALTGRQHPANLGIVLADKIAKEAGIKAFFSDPVATDEWPDFVHLSGFAPVDRECNFHALNQKAMAKKAAEHLGIAYEDARLIVIHLGGGVSVAAHDKGRIVDVFNVMDEGAFALNRSGSIPVVGLVEYCFSGLTKKEALANLQTRGGFLSYLGTQDFREIEKMIQDEDPLAIKVYTAFLWQMRKDVGAMSGVLGFEVDAVVLTGGMANSKMIQQDLTSYLEPLAPVLILPGEREMEALAEGAFYALQHGGKSYAGSIKTDL